MAWRTCVGAWKGAADGQPLAKSSRLLLAAAANVENTGMGWNAEHTSVGTR